jgi:HK97 family phage prohead protease
MQLERHAGIECRFAPSETGTFYGYAAIWNKRDAFGDTLQPGAFARSLAAHVASGTRVLMLRGHDPSDVIGTWRVLQEDVTGLHVDGRLVMETRSGAEAYHLMRAQALDGLSIGFQTVRATGQRGGRLVHEVRLIEISLVARPAQASARIMAVRSLSDPGAAGFAAYIRDCAAKIGEPHGY